MKDSRELAIFGARIAGLEVMDADSVWWHQAPPRLVADHGEILTLEESMPALYGCEWVSTRWDPARNLNQAWEVWQAAFDRKGGDSEALRILGESVTSLYHQRYPGDAARALMLAVFAATPPTETQEGK